MLEREHPLRKLQRAALAVAAVGLVLGIIGVIVSPQQFFRSYLIGYLFWFGIALGSLAILMIQHITGGAWGAVIRRVLESATRTLPLLLVLFVPIAFGISFLYEWAHPEHVADDLVLQHKSAYLNVPFFLLRTLAYFAAWLALVWFLNRWSREQDRRPGPGVDRRLEYLSRGGLLVLGLTVTFASVDWVMSLEPHWFSTIFGILFAGGQVLSAMAFTILIMALLVGRSLAGVVLPRHFHDLGNLLLAFVMLWAYFAFSQLLIIWAGNLPEETPWYLSRLRHGWQWVGLALIVLHFALPFALLLSRDVKLYARRLAIVAALLIAMRFVDLFWLVTPAFSPQAFLFHWLDLSMVLGLGGFWCAVFVWQLQAWPLIPLNDPSLTERVEA